MKATYVLDPKLERTPCIKILSLLLIIILLIGTIGCSVKFSANGEIAKNCVDKLKNMMKDPDSFILTDDVIVVRTKESSISSSHQYVFISYKAKNSFGANISDTAVFCDGKYYSSAYEPDLRESDYKDSEKYRLARIEQLDMKIAFSSWMAEGSYSNEFTETEQVDMKKIAQALKIQYKK